jgi:PAB-dependent poly(A)-specific ribonuclease subunit 3
VRIGSCCIFDVLLFGTPQDITVFQQDDLVKLGRLIFALCTNNVSASNQANMQKSLEMMKKVYSVDVQALALFLCSKIPKVCGDTQDMVWTTRSHDVVLVDDRPGFGYGTTKDSSRA